MPSLRRHFAAVMLTLACAGHASLAWAQQPDPVDAGDAGRGEDAGDAGEELGAVEAAADAGVDGGDDSARIAELTTARDALRALAKGSLPEGKHLRTLAGVDLADASAVEARRKDLEKEVASRRTSAPRQRADGGGDDAARDELARLELDVARARLELLSKPAAELEALAAAERDRERLESERAAAEEERQKALAEAEAAQGALLRALAKERARAEEIRAAQAARRHRIALEKQLWSERDRIASGTRVELTEAASSVTPGTPRADALYDRIVEELSRARDDVRNALDLRERIERAPRFEPAPALLESTDPAGEEGRAKLTALAGALAEDGRKLDEEAERLAEERLASAVARVSALNTTRLGALARVTPEKHDRVLGFGEEGRAQLLREIAHLRLMWTWTWRTRNAAASNAVEKMSSATFIGGLVTRTILLALLVWLARHLAKRRHAWAEAARVALKKNVRRPVFARPLLALVSILRTLLPELLLLAVVLTTPRIFPALEGGAWRVLYVLVRTFAVYRLAIAATHRTIDWLRASPVASGAKTRSEKVLRSVRLAGRYAMFVTFFLVLSEGLLGRGYLYSVAARFAWLGGIPIAATLIRWWRDDIADIYLRRRPSGGLAEQVRNTRGRWYGFFVVVAASLFVFAGFIARSARRFVLSFDQSRKALAYVFRKRLERRADEDVAPPSFDALPGEVRDALTEAPVSGAPLALARFPNIEAFCETLARWQKARSIGSMLLVGKTGIGKTSWLAEAEARASGIETVRIALRERVTSREGVAAAIASALGIEGDLGFDALAGQLRDGPRRLFVVDDAQTFVLRGVGSLDAWEGLLELIERTGESVFWLVAIARYPYEYLRWARRGDDGFRQTLVLPPWTEQEIAELLETRTAQAGWTPVYEDLVIDPVPGPDAEAELVSTGQEYTRLLWDHAQGSPRVALHAWARSLVPDDGKRLRVRLFRRPDEQILEGLGEIPKFVLAAVLWHESLSIEEAACSLRYPPFQCEKSLRFFEEHGVLAAEESRWRVTAEWWSTVNRYLRRKHLIES